MSTVITAKVVVQGKTETGEGDARQAHLTFAPDYADGRNSEWAALTPALSLSMTVKGSVADHFAQGDRFTLKFVKEVLEGGEG